MEMHVIAFFLWHSSKRLLIDIGQPIEESRKGTQRLWVAANKDAGRGLRDFEISGYFWALCNIVDPVFTAVLSHMRSFR
jgi:hypothetical protein